MDDLSDLSKDPEDNIEYQIFNDSTQKVLALINHFFPSSARTENGFLSFNLPVLIDFERHHPATKVSLNVNKLNLGEEKVGDEMFTCLELKFNILTSKFYNDEQFQGAIRFLVGMLNEYFNISIENNKYSLHVQPTGNDLDEPFAEIWRSQNFEAKDQEYLANNIAISISLIPQDN